MKFDESGYERDATLVTVQDNIAGTGGTIQVYRHQRSHAAEAILPGSRVMMTSPRMFTVGGAIAPIFL
ncbi:MAG: hypothetical protein ABIT76_05585 [Chthoniobacterales bacterium]